MSDTSEPDTSEPDTNDPDDIMTPMKTNRKDTILFVLAVICHTFILIGTMILSAGLTERMVPGICHVQNSYIDRTFFIENDISGFRPEWEVNYTSIQTPKYEGKKSVSLNDYQFIKNKKDAEKVLNKYKINSTYDCWLDSEWPQSDTINEAELVLWAEDSSYYNGSVIAGIVLFSLAGITILFAFYWISFRNK